MSGIKIAKFELLEAVLRSGGQEKPPNPHTHVILIVKNPSMTYFLQKKTGVDKKVEFEYLSKDEILQIN